MKMSSNPRRWPARPERKIRWRLKCTTNFITVWQLTYSALDASFKRSSPGKNSWRHSKWEWWQWKISKTGRKASSKISSWRRSGKPSWRNLWRSLTSGKKVGTRSVTRKCFKSCNLSSGLFRRVFRRKWKRSKWEIWRKRRRKGLRSTRTRNRICGFRTNCY